MAMYDGCCNICASWQITFECSTIIAMQTKIRAGKVRVTKKKASQVEVKVLQKSVLEVYTTTCKK